MAHGLVLRMQDHVRNEEMNQVMEREMNMNGWSGDKLIMYWKKSASQSADTKMEFVILLRETLLHVFSPDWLHYQNRNYLVQAIKENYRRFPEIVKSRPQMHEVLERIFPDPWYNSFFSWDDLFQKKLTFADRCVQDFFHAEPEDIILGRIHSFAKNGRYKEAFILAKQSFLFHYRITKHAVFYSKPPSPDRNRYMPEKSRIGHASIDWIVLLIRKYRSLYHVTEEILKFSCHEGVEIIGRMRENPKLKTFALECLQFLLVQDIVSKTSKYCCTKKFYILFCMMHMELNSSPKQFAASASKIIAGVAPSSAHLYLFVEAAYELYGDRYIDLYIDFYVRGLTADLNHLEVKKQDESLDEVNNLEEHIVFIFEKLSSLFLSNSHPEAARECIFSAFSLRPTRKRLEDLLRLTYSLDTNSQKQLNFTSSDNSLFPVKNCSHGLRCDGSCSSATNTSSPELMHPLLSKGVRNISYKVITDFVSILECKRHIRFQYNYFDWHLNVSELDEHLKDFIAESLSKTARGSDTVGCDAPRTGARAMSAEDSQVLDKKSNGILASVKRKSSEISKINLPTDVAANIEVGSQVPCKKSKLQNQSSNAYPLAGKSKPTSFENVFEKIIIKSLNDNIPKGGKVVYSMPVEKRVNKISSGNQTIFTPAHSNMRKQHHLFADARNFHPNQSVDHYSSRPAVSSPSAIRQSVVVAPPSNSLARTEHHFPSASGGAALGTTQKTIIKGENSGQKIWKRSLSSGMDGQSALNLSSPGRGNVEKKKHYIQNYLQKAAKFAPLEPLDPSPEYSNSEYPPPPKKQNCSLNGEPSDRNSVSVIQHTMQHLSKNTDTVLSQSSPLTSPKQMPVAMHPSLCKPSSSAGPGFRAISSPSKLEHERFVHSHVSKVPTQPYGGSSSPNQSRKSLQLPELPRSVSSITLQSSGNPHSPSQKASDRGVDQKPSHNFRENSMQSSSSSPKHIQSHLASQINHQWMQAEVRSKLLANSNFQSRTLLSPTLQNQFQKPSSSASSPSHYTDNSSKILHDSLRGEYKSFASNRPSYASPNPKLALPSHNSSSASSPSMGSPILATQTSSHRQSPSSLQTPSPREKSRSILSMKVLTPEPVKLNLKNSTAYFERFKPTSPPCRKHSESPQQPPVPHSSSASPLLCDRLSGGPPVQHSTPYGDKVLARDSKGVLVFSAQTAVPATSSANPTCCSPMEAEPCSSCTVAKTTKADPRAVQRDHKMNSSEVLSHTQEAPQDYSIDYSARSQDSKTAFDSNYGDIISCRYCLLELPNSLMMTHIENSHREKLKLKEYDFMEDTAPKNSPLSVYSSSHQMPRVSVPFGASGDTNLQEGYFNWLEVDPNSPAMNLVGEPSGSIPTSMHAQHFNEKSNGNSTPAKSENSTRFSNYTNMQAATSSENALLHTASTTDHQKAADNRFEKFEDFNTTQVSAAKGSNLFSSDLASEYTDLSKPRLGDESKAHCCSLCKREFESFSLFEEHLKTFGPCFGGLRKTLESGHNNSSLTLSSCDAPQSMGRVKTEESISCLNPVSSTSNVTEVSETDSTANVKPKKEKKAKSIPCRFCKKLITIPYMKTHFSKMHKEELDSINMQKSVKAEQNSPVNSPATNACNEEVLNSVLTSPTWSNVTKERVSVSGEPNSNLGDHHTHAVTVSKNYEEMFPPFADTKSSPGCIKCPICLRSLTNESFLKKHLKNIHGVEGSLPENFLLEGKPFHSEINQEVVGESHPFVPVLNSHSYAQGENSYVEDNLLKSFRPMDSVKSPGFSSDLTLSCDGDSARVDTNSDMLQSSGGFSAGEPDHSSVSGNTSEHSNLEKSTKIFSKVKSEHEELKYTPPLHKASFTEISHVVKANLLSGSFQAPNTGENNNTSRHGAENDLVQENTSKEIPCHFCSEMYDERDLVRHLSEKHSVRLSKGEESHFLDPHEIKNPCLGDVNEINRNLSLPFDRFGASNVKMYGDTIYESTTSRANLVPVERGLTGQPSQSSFPTQVHSQLTYSSVPFSGHYSNKFQLPSQDEASNVSQKKLTEDHNEMADALNETFRGAEVHNGAVPPARKRSSKSYTCDICNKTLSSSGNLMRHKKTLHLGITRRPSNPVPPESHISTHPPPKVEMTQGKNLAEENQYPCLDQNELAIDPISFPVDNLKMPTYPTSVNTFPTINDKSNDNFDLMLSELFGAREQNDESLRDLGSALTYTSGENNTPVPIPLNENFNDNYFMGHESGRNATDVNQNLHNLSNVQAIPEDWHFGANVSSNSILHSLQAPVPSKHSDEADITADAFVNQLLVDADNSGNLPVIQSTPMQNNPNDPPTAIHLASPNIKHENPSLNVLDAANSHRPTNSSENTEVLKKPSKIPDQISQFILPNNTCSGCQKVYSNKYALHVHIKKIHLHLKDITIKKETSEIKAQCTNSVSLLNNSSAMKEEKEKIECPLCGKKLAKGSLLRHKRKIHESDKNENGSPKFKLPVPLSLESTESHAITMEYNQNGPSSSEGYLSAQNQTHFPPDKKHSELKSSQLTYGQSSEQFHTVPGYPESKVGNHSVLNCAPHGSTIESFTPNSVDLDRKDDKSQCVPDRLNHNDFERSKKGPEVTNEKGSNALLQLAETFLGINCSNFPRNSSGSSAEPLLPQPLASKTASCWTETKEVALTKSASRSEHSTASYAVENSEKTYQESSGLKESALTRFDSHSVQNSHSKIELDEPPCLDVAPLSSNFTQLSENPVSKLAGVSDGNSFSEQHSKSTYQSNVINRIDILSDDFKDPNEFAPPVLENLDAPHKSEDLVKNIHPLTVDNLTTIVQDNPKSHIHLSTDILEKVPLERSSELNLDPKSVSLHVTPNNSSLGYSKFSAQLGLNEVQGTSQASVTFLSEDDLSNNKVTTQLENNSHKFVRGKDRHLPPLKEDPLDVQTNTKGNDENDILTEGNISDSVLQKSNQCKECRLCFRVFKSMPALSKHLKSVHSVPLLKKVITHSVSQCYLEHDNKLSPPNLSMISTHDGPSSESLPPKASEDNIDSSMKKILEKNRVSVSTVNEAPSNSHAASLKSQMPPFNTKQIPPSIETVDSVLDKNTCPERMVSNSIEVTSSTALKKDNSFTNGNGETPSLSFTSLQVKEVSLKAVSEANAIPTSSPKTSIQPRKSQIRKQSFSRRKENELEPVLVQDENKTVLNTSEHDQVCDDISVICSSIPEESIESCQHSLPKCIIKVCKGRKNSVSYKISEKDGVAVRTSKTGRKATLRKREECDSDDSVIILSSDSVVSDDEVEQTLPRRTKRKRIPHRRYRDEDFRKGTFNIRLGFSKPSFHKKTAFKPKKVTKNSVRKCGKTDCIQTFKGLLDIQQFLKEHKQPWVILPRIEDFVSNFDMKVNSYSLSDDTTSKPRALLKKVSVSKPDDSIDANLTSVKGSGCEITIKTEDGFESPCSTPDSKVNLKNSKEMEKPVFNVKDKTEGSGVFKKQCKKRNPKHCSCGCCEFCISLSPIKECCVILQKLPAEVF